jgi:hypothetical protein
VNETVQSVCAQTLQVRLMGAPAEENKSTTHRMHRTHRAPNHAACHVAVDSFAAAWRQERRIDAVFPLRQHAHTQKRTHANTRHKHERKHQAGANASTKKKSGKMPGNS